MSDRSAPILAVAGLAAAALIVLPLLRDDEGATGFDGSIQSGTCADPTDDLVVDLEDEDDADDETNDVEPYLAVGADGEPVTVGYYGASEVPGFGVGLLHTGEPFSLVLSDPDSDEAVACGDLLQPDDEGFEEVGVAVVQLLPVEGSDVQGFAILERARLERELDIPPTRARIVLSAEPVPVPAEVVEGYEVLVQGGSCATPSEEDLLLEMESDDEHDVSPFDAVAPGSTDPVTVAYYGASGVPGFGLAAAYTDHEFSLVITDPGSNDPVACGDVLEPDDDKYTETGLALVQLLPTGDAGPQGFALVDRRGMQRELDITPTLLRVLLFAPPAEGA